MYCCRQDQGHLKDTLAGEQDVGLQLMVGDQAHPQPPISVLLPRLWISHQDQRALISISRFLKKVFTHTHAPKNLTKTISYTKIGSVAGLVTKND